MKPGRNDPCPCGRGRKYKKCCGALGPSRVEREATSEEPIASCAVDEEHADSFPPFAPGRQPTRPLETQELKARLTPEQDAFIRRALHLFREGDTRDAERALRMLSTIPEPARWFMKYSVLLEMELLRKLERPAERKRTLFRFLRNAASAEEWANQAFELQDWIESLRDTSEYSEMLDALRDVCAQHPFGPPRLLLAGTLARELPVPDEAVELFREALEPERWRSHPATLGPWLPLLARGAFCVEATYVERGQREEAVRCARLAASYPWRSARGLSHYDFQLLCTTLFDAGLDRDLTKLCKDFRGVNGWRSPRYWLGAVAWRQGKHDVACTHFVAAIGGEDLSDHEHGVMATNLLCHDRPADARRAIDCIQAREGTRFLTVEGSCLQEEDRWSEAVDCWDRVLELVPDDAWVQVARVTALLNAGRFEEYEANLRAIVADPDHGFYDTARLQLACWSNDRGRSQEGMELLRPYLDDDVQYGLEPHLRPLIMGLAGDTFAKLGDDEQAVQWYERALAARCVPSPVVPYARALVRLERSQAADRLLAELRSEPDDDMELAMLRLVVADRLGRREEVLRRYERFDTDWLRREGCLPTALGPAVRALLDLDQPMEAVELCEAVLEDVLADPSLKPLREAAMRRIRAQADAAKSDAEEQRRRADEAEELRRLAERHRRRDLAALHASKDHVRRFQQAQRCTAAAAASVDLPQWLSDLDPKMRAQIQSAELIWQQLSGHADADHGPVVVQLARVVEGEANRVLVDELVRIHLAAGGELDTFPGAGSRLPMERGNRFSLGQVAELVTGAVERREADGSVTLVRGARGNERHQRLLDALQEKVRNGGLPESLVEWMRDKLPLVLAEVAQVRNRAGHAGDPMGRREAGKVRVRILGTGPEDGLITRLRGIGRAIGRFALP